MMNEEQFEELMKAEKVKRYLIASLVVGVYLIVIFCFIMLIEI
ncbi:hypothetical protein [Ornithinibacillus xuwenensis]|jgi:hypothetical protein|uniref:Uncharacterized protein n=1 Tax=Ornithinibacillus xuwenensis TaxID=3144668 RepID=A0ABU9XCV7_9BACI